MSAGRNWRGGSVVAALTCGALMTWSGPAVAAPKPALAAGDISTVAGGVGGPARATTVSLGVCGIAFGGGHLYLAGSGTVRSVNPAGDGLTTPAGIGNVPGPLGIYTVAGGAIGGFAGDGRRGIFAELNQPTGVAVDGAGNLLIADSGNSRIREVAG